jgi:hypothetical protein
MRKILTVIVATATLAGAAVATSAPAFAWRGGGWGWGWGLGGFAAGAIRQRTGRALLLSVRRALPGAWPLRVAARVERLCLGSSLRLRRVLDVLKLELLPGVFCPGDASAQSGQQTSAK